MPGKYTRVQELLPSILAMKGESCTMREIANHFGLTKGQIKELCKRARRKERKMEKGYRQTEDQSFGEDCSSAFCAD